MYPHHIESAQKLREYFEGQEGVIAVVLDGSTVKGNARPDSDIDAIIVVTEEKYAELAAQNRLAEVIPGHCTYEGGYFDVKYKTKAILADAALHASSAPLGACLIARRLVAQACANDCHRSECYSGHFFLLVCKFSGSFVNSSSASSTVAALEA